MRRTVASRFRQSQAADEISLGDVQCQRNGNDRDEGRQVGHDDVTSCSQMCDVEYPMTSLPVVKRATSNI